MKRNHRKGNSSHGAKNEKPLTLDDVFGQVTTEPLSSPSGASSTSALAVSSNVRLTPLSNEACLKHGINPQFLRERDFNSFREDGQSVQIQSLKYNAYETRRQMLMKTAKEEKEKLLSTRLREDAQSVQTGGMSLTPSIILEQQKKANQHMLEQEKLRLAKAKEKQRRELLQMLHFEEKMDKIQTEMRLKSEKDAAKEERLKAEKKRRDRQAAEERRIREIRRKAKEEAEEEMFRINTRNRFEKERRIRNEKEQQELENKRRACAVEQEREKKRMLQRLQTEHQQEIKRRDIEQKMDEREKKERERAAKQELKRLMDKRQQEEKRMESKKRIVTNKETALKQEEQRKKDLMEKQMKSTRKQEYIRQKHEQDRMKTLKEREALARKREYQGREAKRAEEAMKASLLKKFKEDEEHMAMLKQKKEEKMQLLREEREVQVQMKRENVERIKRMHEYKRLETMNKVKSAEQRTQNMLQKKEELARMRRKNAVQQKIKKDKLKQRLEEKSKASGTKAIKKILAELTIDDESVKKGKKKCRTNRSIDSYSKQQRIHTIKVSNKAETGLPPSIIEISPDAVDPHSVLASSKQ